jgi:hypothetical protein
LAAFLVVCRNALAVFLDDVALQQLSHPSYDRFGLRRDGIVQQHPDVTLTEATNKVTTAHVLAEARDTRLRHVWAERGVAKG